MEGAGGCRLEGLQASERGARLDPTEKLTSLMPNGKEEVPESCR